MSEEIDLAIQKRTNERERDYSERLALLVLFSDNSAALRVLTELVSEGVEI